MTDTEGNFAGVAVIGLRLAYSVTCSRTMNLGPATR